MWWVFRCFGCHYHGHYAKINKPRKPLDISIYEIYHYKVLRVKYY